MKIQAQSLARSAALTVTAVCLSGVATAQSGTQPTGTWQISILESQFSNNPEVISGSYTFECNMASGSASGTVIRDREGLIDKGYARSYATISIDQACINEDHTESAGIDAAATAEINATYFSFDGEDGAVDVEFLLEFDDIALEISNSLIYHVISGGGTVESLCSLTGFNSIDGNVLWIGSGGGGAVNYDFGPVGGPPTSSGSQPTSTVGGVTGSVVPGTSVQVTTNGYVAANTYDLILDAESDISIDITANTFAGFGGTGRIGITPRWDGRVKFLSMDKVNEE